MTDSKEKKHAPPSKLLPVKVEHVQDKESYLADYFAEISMPLPTISRDAIQSVTQLESWSRILPASEQDSIAESHKPPSSEADAYDHAMIIDSLQESAQKGHPSTLTDQEMPLAEEIPGIPLESKPVFATPPPKTFRSPPGKENHLPRTVTLRSRTKSITKKSSGPRKPFNWGRPQREAIVVSDDEDEVKDAKSDNDSSTVKDLEVAASASKKMKHDAESSTDSSESPLPSQVPTLHMDVNRTETQHAPGTPPFQLLSTSIQPPEPPMTSTTSSDVPSGQNIIVTMGPPKESATVKFANRMAEKNKLENNSQASSVQSAQNSKANNPSGVSHLKAAPFKGIPERAQSPAEGTSNRLPTPNPSGKVNGRAYTRLGLIGRGGSSRVFKVVSATSVILALKRVSFEKAEQATIDGYMNEIDLLKRLMGNSRIIRYWDAEVNLSKGYLSVLMEYGEIDFAHMLLSQREQEFDIHFIGMYWRQMLEAVQVIHNEKIVHADLKPANFLLVQGSLKLIDFGIAKAIANDTTNILREGQSGTANYMAPEAIEDSPVGRKFGRAADVWSLGCILYQMVYGKTPFSDIVNIFRKLNVISSPDHRIEFPTSILSPLQPRPVTTVVDNSKGLEDPFRVQSVETCPVAGRKSETNASLSQPKIQKTIEVDLNLIQVMKGCLARLPKDRMTIPELLQHSFLHPHQ
ncbi:Dual-specificity kinase, spindle pole body (SPB) duplication and spindle checkpoint function [Modicella reniformis]|uniref:Dual-specificity kinase, spindle pole body (SPB) duplication and spindle checkpoint function n=1 Tax=Modicella reniformis TaxID=1440133 RepID=A0A9P6IZD0_9FUNG|nr:Dual-specificity kinase, spindle pole body (SPB) duplication and spindle checkpoint function [Modicella reniformis]